MTDVETVSLFYQKYMEIKSTFHPHNPTPGKSLKCIIPTQFAFKDNQVQPERRIRWRMEVGMQELKFHAPNGGSKMTAGCSN